MNSKEINLKQVVRIANNLRNARAPIIFTGSGCSVHLGIPDFQSGQENIQTQAGPLKFEQTPVYNPFGLNIDTWNLETWKNSNPEVFISLLTDFHEKILVNNGNRHWLSAVLTGDCLDESYKKLSMVAGCVNAIVVTQNIDGLHKINADKETVVELFGNFEKPESVVLMGGFASGDVRNLFDDLQQGKHDYCLVIGSKLEINLAADVVRYCGKYDVVDLHADENNYHIDGLGCKLQSDFVSFIDTLFARFYPQGSVITTKLEPATSKAAKANISDISGLRVVAFTGESGTGKSAVALKIAKENGIEAIIDDGLLLYYGTVQTGESAKKYLTGSEQNISATKNAMFMAKDNPFGKSAVKSALSLGYRTGLITSVMIIGTSEKMVENIRKNLGLSLISRYIRIEEVTTPEQRAAARESRCKNTGHALPVDADFPGKTSVK
ncbi:MAG: Sir2 family NAD-dependent protein deacetylase [Bacillota bacterium]